MAKFRVTENGIYWFSMEIEATSKDEAEEKFRDNTIPQKISFEVLEVQTEEVK